MACAVAPLRSGHEPEDAAARQRFVAAAMSMRGQPYRFGGSVPGGFDCSGLVAFAAAASGLHLPRTAREQMAVGRPVQREQITTGDLVFMRLGAKLHVGIASNSIEFVHAPSSGGKVRIDRLDAPPYSKTFLAARRLVG